MLDTVFHNGKTVENKTNFLLTHSNMKQQMIEKVKYTHSALDSNGGKKEASREGR